MTVIIIGSGLAGYLLVKEIREQGSDIKIKVFTNDSGDFYSKPQISNAFALNKTAQELVTMSGADFSKKYNFDLYANTEVQDLLPEKKQIIAGGTTYDFDQCVIATGANVKVSAWGDLAYHVNNLDDYKKLRLGLIGTRKIAIVGAGLVGCELAADLIQSDFDVTLFHDCDTPIQRLLPSQCGLFLKQNLLASGINWQTAVDVKVSKNGPKTLVNDSEFDLVISALGIEPNVNLARRAGLHINNGIVVDAYCQTSVDSIFALGDCANVCGDNLAYIAPIRHCVNVLSMKLMAKQTLPIKYPAMPVILKTPMCKTIIQPPAELVGDWQYHVEEDSLLARFESSGKLHGFILMGTALKQRSGLLKELVAK